jgi:hypothetical protein
MNYKTIEIIIKVIEIIADILISTKSGKNKGGTKK